MNARVSSGRSPFACTIASSSDVPLTGDETARGTSLYSGVMRVVAGSFPRKAGYSFRNGQMEPRFGPGWDINPDTVASVSYVETNKSYNWGQGTTGIASGALLAGPLGALVGGLLPNAHKDVDVRFVIMFRDGRQAHCEGSPNDFSTALQYSLEFELEPVTPKNSPYDDPEQAERNRARIRSELATKKEAEELRVKSENERFYAERAAAKEASKQEKLVERDFLETERAAVRATVEKAKLEAQEATRLKRDAARIAQAEQLAATAIRKLTPEERTERKARKKAVIDQRLPFVETMRLTHEIDKDYQGPSPTS